MKNERAKSDITKPLYETDGQLYDFTARVIDCVELKQDSGKKLYGIVLDETAFFPEGGGQQADTGYFEPVRELYDNASDRLLQPEGSDDSEQGADARTAYMMNVMDVQTDENGCILHYIDKPLAAGTVVTGHVDKDIRFARMQNHSGEHLVSGLIYSMFGYDNVGFHMLETGARFDCSGPLDSKQLDELEKAANRAIYENVPIKISYPDKAEAAGLEYRSKLDIEEGIRLVTIEGYDVCACCAPHLKSTGQIGVIKIIDAMPHRGGMRITMAAGMDALNDYCMLHNNNGKIMALLSSKREDTADYSKDFADRFQKLKEENAGLKKEMTAIITERVLEKIRSRKAEDTSVEVIFTEALDNTGLRNLINSCTEIFDGVVAGFMGNDAEGYRYILSTKGHKDIQEVNRAIIEKLSGRGGGNKQMIQGSLTATEVKIRQVLGKL